MRVGEAEDIMSNNNLDIRSEAWCEICQKTKQDVLIIYERYDNNVCAECMEEALAIIANKCPNCQDNRTGKGSLIYMGRAFCDESCFEQWRDKVLNNG